MSTISKATLSNQEDSICQGDVYKNVKYSYIDSEDDESVDIIEYEFPLAVIISQACDVIAMEGIVNEGRGKPTKFMPSILLCPIYEKNQAKTGQNIENAFFTNEYTMEKENVFQKDDIKVADRDWHYRYHSLKIQVEDNVIVENAIVDFKHYFSVPMQYLVKNKHNRIVHLDDLFAEQLTLKFATYLSRVAIP